MIEKFEGRMTFIEYVKALCPSVLSMIFLSFYTTIDGFFVARYAGSDQLAAINIVIPTTCLIYGFAVMLSTGGGAAIGKSLGRGDYKRASEIFSSLSLVLIIFSAVVTIIGIFFNREISLMLGSSYKLLPYVMPYGLVTFIATLPMCFKLYFEYLTRTCGHAHMGLYMSILGLVLNIIFDYVLVGVYDLETLGAGLGTMLSIFFSALLGLIFFLKSSPLEFVKPRLNTKLFFIAITGIGDMLTELSTGITTFLFNIIIMKYLGEDGIAAITIIMYIYYFFIAFYMGISVATSPIISYNYGKDNRKKMKEILTYSFICVIISQILIFLFSYFKGDIVIRLFARENPVFSLTSDALKTFSLLFIFVGINVLVSSYFTAIGKGVHSAIISALRSLILVCPFLIILPQFIGPLGIWLAMPLSEAVTLVLSLFMYGKWGSPIYAGSNKKLTR